MEAAPRMNALEWALLLLLSVIWGSTYFFAKAALADLGPFSIVLGRVVIGATTLYVIARLLRQTLPRDTRLWRDFAIMGLINNVIPFSLIFWGQIEVASGLAATLNATTPFLAIMVGRMLHPTSRIHSYQILGIALGLGGVIAIVGPSTLGGLSKDLPGQIAMLGAALSYAFAGHFGRRFREFPPIVPATGQVTCSALCMMPIALMIDRPWAQPLPSLETWAYLAALGVLCTAGAYLIYFRLLSSAGAVNLLLVTIMIPPSAILLGWLFLNERLSATDCLGLALVGLGLLTIDGRIWSRLKPTRSEPFTR